MNLALIEVVNGKGILHNKKVMLNQQLINLISLF